MLPWVIRETTLVGTSELTVVNAEAVLLLGFGSVVSAATVAVFVIVPGVLGAVTTISTVAVAPLGKMPRLHVTVLVAEQVPLLGVAETNVTPAGRTSVRVTPLVVAGMAGVPLFVTVKW
jgi:fluoride ion exporter CrcB/FEX